MSMREKVRARLIETMPRPPAGPAGKPRAEGAELTLEPMVVSEPRGVRELAKLLASEKQRLAAERFTPVKGGTIYQTDRLELGSWWSPDKGWQFLKIKW